VWPTLAFDTRVVGASTLINLSSRIIKIKEEKKTEDSQKVKITQNEDGNEKEAKTC
jgi:hypothetical protein